MTIIEIPGLTDDPERVRHHHHLQHIAFEFRTIDGLMGTYVRLKESGIVPVLPVDEGSQTAFYYADPDRNSIELNVDNYGDNLTSIEHIQNSPEFARRPQSRSFRATVRTSLWDSFSPPSARDVESRCLPSVVFMPIGPLAYQWQTNRNTAQDR